jgi:hypothetical protein
MESRRSDTRLVVNVVSVRLKEYLKPLLKEGVVGGIDQTFANTSHMNTRRIGLDID